MKRRKYELKQTELESKNEELKDNLKKFKSFFIFGIYLMIQGFVLSVIGFKRWKSKVQDLLDEKLELELKILKNEIKKSS